MDNWGFMGCLMGCWLGFFSLEQCKSVIILVRLGILLHVFCGGAWGV